MKSLANPLTAESTQTIRALTPAELVGSTHSKWYVVQLAISDQSINLEMMPSLDIFAEHRLYTVVGSQGGRYRHALRLGFFSEEGLAAMMCKRLQIFFAAPTVIRVSVAEQERFAGKSAAKHESGATSSPQVMSMGTNTQDRSAAASTPSRTTALTGVPNPASTGNSGAFLPPEFAMKTGAFRAMAPQPRSAGSLMPGDQSSARTPVQAGTKKKKSLSEELMEEARQVQRSRSGKPSVAAPSQTWLSRLFGHPKR